MTRRQNGIPSFALAVLGAALLFPPSLSAQQPTASFEISGTSTVRGWTCPAHGTIEVTPGSTSEPVPGFPNGVGSVAITVQVRDIQCPEEQMIEHMREAMEEPEHPEIVYQLEQYRFTSDDTAVTSGSMTIHGVTKPISFEVELERSPGGVRGVGRASLTLTDFGIAPPSLWGGLLNVGNVVEVKFDAALPPSN